MRSVKEHKVFYAGLWVFLLGSIIFFISLLSLNRLTLPTPLWLMFLLLDGGFIVFIFIPQPGRTVAAPPGAAAARDRWYPRTLADIVEGKGDGGEEGVLEPVRAISPVPLIPLALLFGLLILAAPVTPDEQEWRADEAGKLEAIYLKAEVRIGELEAVGRELGAGVSRIIGTRNIDGMDVPERAALVHRIDSLAGEFGAGLFPFHEVGIQVFSSVSGRTAWGGRPRYVRDVPRGDYEARVFTSRSRMYTLLVNNMPCPGGNRVVVDIPLEVNYRINNQFLRSTSLGEALSERYGREIQFSFSMGEHRGEMRWADERLDTLRTRVDYDPGTGVVVSGVVKAFTGLPIAYLKVLGVPFASVLEKREGRRVLWGGFTVTLIVAAIALWMYRRYAKRGARGGERGKTLLRRLCMLMGFLFLIRFLLLRLDLPSALFGTSLFDPGFFADEAPFGLMRTTGDFLVTALFALILVFGSIKAFRTYYPARLEKALAGEGAFHGLRFVVKAALLGVLLGGVMLLAERIVSRVVLNANPRLLGLDVQYLSLPVISLHLAMLFMVSAFFIAFLFIARLVLVWGSGGRREAFLASIAALAILAAAMRPHWLLLAAAAALLFLSAKIFPLLRKEEIVSIVLSSFFLVLICTLVIFDVASMRYTELRESRVLEKAGDFNHPEDNWLEVVLPDVCQEISRDRGIVSKIFSRKESAAFEIWAESSFSRFNLSCIIDTYDAKERNFSHFEVGIPFRTPPLGDSIMGLEGKPVVRSGRMETSIGAVYYYRGIAPVYGLRGQEVGAVVITVPYFFENTELLARTGPLAPEILQNIEPGALAPRVDEPENLLVARVRDRRVVESSLPLLASGTRLPGSGDSWFILNLDRERYNCVLETGPRGAGYLVGYRIAGVVESLLMWATVVSLDVILTALSLVALVVLRRLPVLGSVIPAVSLGGRLGFREKILLSFLVVSILPVLIIGGFSGRFIQRSFQREGERVAIEGVREAASLIEYSIRAEAESFAGSQYLREILGGDRDARVRDVALNESAYFTLFDGAGKLLLDEGMSDFSDDEVRLLLSEANIHRGTITFEPPHLYGGVVIALPVSGGAGTSGTAVDSVRSGETAGAGAADVSGETVHAGAAGGYLYYRRRLDDQFLHGITDVIGTDINIYFDGLLRASSERELFIGGFIEPIVAPAVFADIALMGSRTIVQEAKLGDYSYQVASAPLVSITHGESGVLSVPMLYQPSLIKREVLKSSSLMLGLLALLFAATVAIGVFLAGKIFTPVAALIGGTRRIISGDLGFKLESKAPDEIGELVGSFNTMTAALQEARRDLLERQRYLAAVLDNVATGVIAIDRDGTIITLNPSGERILGLDRGEVVGRKPGEIAHEGLAPLFALFSEEGGIREREVDLHAGERRRTIKAVLTGLEEKGERLGTVIVFDDLTELIRSKKLSAWIEMARQIAHEVKNPLTPIKLSAQLMRRAYREGSAEFGEIFESGVETVIQQTEILRRISSEFSSFGRVTRLRPEVVPLDPFLSELVTSYRGAAGIEIVYEPGEAPAAVADREGLRKVLVNVMENALEAMPDGGTVTVRTRRAGGAVEVVIEDTGAGLPADVRERLFEPYFSTKTNGTGLGLAICQGLVRGMDGDIRLRNRSDVRGVQAIVTLPSGG
ncbi:MAG TPA: ATP-binding protein [Patescibacteria group bacterium]|nr:ATP-binding protein [Patescibacteria group bacterium]